MDIAEIIGILLVGYIIVELISIPKSLKKLSDNFEETNRYLREIANELEKLNKNLKSNKDQ